MAKNLIKVEDSPISFSYLRKFNLGMGILHTVQAVIMALLGISSDFTRPIQTFYLDFVGAGNGPEGSSFAPTPETWFVFDSVGLWVAGFLGMSAIAHFLIAGPFFNRYVENLKNYFNPIRWFEYALSSSFMIVFIALLVGVWDFWTLFLIFGINASMNLFGYSQELINNKERMESGNISWINYFFGWFAGIVPWVVAISYYAQAAAQNPGPPEFVTYILIAQIILFNSFAFNMLFQYLRIGPWKDYLYGERMYQILSLVAKTVLAWLVYGGIFQPE